MDDVTVTVAAVHGVGADAVAIEFDSPDGFQARPGQFVKLGAEVDGETYNRFYTISSADVTDTFEVTVEVDPEGAFGPYLGALETDDTLTAAGPFGNAYYEDESRAVILAGGPGVGPAVGIARRALAEGNEAAVVYRDDDPIHEDALAEAEAEGATVHVLDADDPMGATVADVLAGTAGEQVFVYGFAEFIDAATAAIDAAGGDADAAKVESFGG